ncbi:rhodanese-related sulfurtransferase [Desulfosalsimonas propionicica]|uniref:Rhodanese-related sulfurtransferase n=1 Tax=Desulfosalsimonas propionicica TaxID=332175 RepID=A0A7W0HKC6_9BACT|nr:rhodanese-like domain-containing protein [Desulfosalsimonas propionicica]MBA2880926.1 rhodanese-related sulfurtransferase [Desulfosalsimonas propionicica]
MGYNNRPNLKKAFWQAGAVVAAASVIALAANHFRQDGIALVADWSPAARLEVATNPGDITISADRAAAFHQSGNTVFIDTRPPGAFFENRIAGAINIPKQDVFDHLESLMEAVPDKNRIVVVYCEKAPCSLSRELVRLLKNMGYANARLLENGWARWKDRGYPADAG